MTLQAAIDSELSFLRAEAESRMTSTVAVMRKTGGTTTDANGYEVPEWATVYAASPFRLGGANAGSAGTRTVTVGSTEMQLAVRTGHFPATAVLLADGDLIEITSGENAGLVLQIIEADWQDQATARRVPVVSTKRPEEWV
jgi:hypothetical protein